MITQDSIQNLKNHLDIVDTLSNFIELRKAGANFKALCPFHGEDTPSFVVSPKKQIYHCFGCGAGGDSIKFVMEYEKLNYPEAIEKLALTNNISLEYEQGTQIKKDYKILDQVKNFYKENLDNNKSSLEYLSKRGVYESSIEEFEIGFAPSSNETINFLRSNMLPISDAIEQGVIGESNNIFARFIDRIIFPIYTPNGQVTGFGGRTITGHSAKYINSPQSKFFNKSKLLYGYSRAKDSIYKKGEIIITEGYLDVIMLHQANFKNATATLGTALTSDHLPLIRKGEPKVILAYDGDKAGLSAAYKASTLMASGSIDGGVVIFGDGKDPADMVKESRLEELKSLFNSPIPFIKFIIDSIITNYDLSNPNHKQKALEETKSFLQTMPSLIANEYKEYLSSAIKVDIKYITLKSAPLQQQNMMNLSNIDMAEASLIKSAVENSSFIDDLVNFMDIDMFRFHTREYQLLLEFKFNDPLIMNLLMNEEIKIYSEDDFYEQLRTFIINRYKEQILNVKSNALLSFSDKSFKLRDIRYKIQTLQSGKMV